MIFEGSHCPVIWWTRIRRPSSAHFGMVEVWIEEVIGTSGLLWLGVGCVFCFFFFKIDLSSFRYPLTVLDLCGFLVALYKKQGFKDPSHQSKPPIKVKVRISWCSVGCRCAQVATPEPEHAAPILHKDAEGATPAGQGDVCLQTFVSSKLFPASRQWASRLNGPQGLMGLKAKWGQVFDGCFFFFFFGGGSTT